MNRLMRNTACGFAAMLFATASLASDGGYYSKYTHYPSHGYHAAYYYYKPAAAAPAYRYHYCVRFPGEQYVYYYDPGTKHFWGRYDLKANGFSLLPANDRKGKVQQIDQTAFPPPGPVMNNPATGNQLEAPPTPPD